MPLSRVQRYLKHGSLPQLAVFEACVRLGSFTRAAEELHIAQPTVSTQIRKLTETVGLPLFEQIGKRIHLTESGKLLYETSLGIFSAVEDMECRLRDLRGLQAGRLRLAVGTTGKYFVPRLLAAFVERHRGIAVELEVHNRQALFERMAANRDDLYVFSHPPTAVNVVRQAILPNPIVFFARSGHPLARQHRIPLERIAQEPFLMREAGSGTRMVAESIFSSAGVEPRVSMVLNSDESIGQAALAGIGLAFMPRHTYGQDNHHAGLAELDVVGLPFESQWQIGYPASKEISTVARTFMEFAGNAAKALLPGGATAAGPVLPRPLSG